jgi:hypothetical protein
MYLERECRRRPSRSAVMACPLALVRHVWVGAQVWIGAFLRLDHGVFWDHDYVVEIGANSPCRCPGSYRSRDGSRGRGSHVVGTHPEQEANDRSLGHAVSLVDSTTVIGSGAFVVH